MKELSIFLFGNTFIASFYLLLYGTNGGFHTLGDSNKLRSGSITYKLKSW